MFKAISIFLMTLLVPIQIFALERSGIESKIRAFTKSFDDNDLDAVMKYFSADAIYRTVQGDTFKGTDQIRAAFEPQFNGAYGKMSFDIAQVNVDESLLRLTLVWTCRHDFTVKANGIQNNITRIFYKLMSGQKAFWYGLDVFEFDNNGLIKIKSSYTTSKFPRMFKETASEN